MFYDKFEMLRKEKGVTIKEVTQQVGIDRTTIYKWRDEGSAPRNETLVKIANYFNVSVDFLLGQDHTNLFSERLKELRKERNLTQMQLAKDLNVSLGAIGNWETGNRTPDVNMLGVIANYFSVTVDYLGGKTEQKKPLVNNDEELSEYLYLLKTRPEMRMLFKVSSKATKADVEKAVRIIEAIRNDEKDEPPST